MRDHLFCLFVHLVKYVDDQYVCGLVQSPYASHCFAIPNNYKLPHFLLFSFSHSHFLLYIFLMTPYHTLHTLLLHLQHTRLNLIF